MMPDIWSTLKSSVPAGGGCAARSAETKDCQLEKSSLTERKGEDQRLNVSGILKLSQRSPPLFLLCTPELLNLQITEDGRGKSSIC
jgi:hypothetical protein